MYIQKVDLLNTILMVPCLKSQYKFGILCKKINIFVERFVLLLDAVIKLLENIL